MLIIQTHTNTFDMETRKMKRTHPGLILRMELTEGRGLTISKIADLLDTTRSNMSNVLNGRAAISPNMALRIEAVFGGSAEHLMRLQTAYDFQKAKEEFLHNPPSLKKFEYTL